QKSSLCYGITPVFELRLIKKMPVFASKPKFPTYS
ncbi:MAG: hypothetical protein ACI8X3_003145, partial [Saprospiraceae bacterium]